MNDSVTMLVDDDDEWMKDRYGKTVSGDPRTPATELEMRQHDQSLEVNEFQARMVAWTKADENLWARCKVMGDKGRAPTMDDVLRDADKLYRWMVEGVLPEAVGTATDGSGNVVRLN